MPASPIEYADRLVGLACQCDNHVAVPCLADGGIEFLDSGNDNLGITVQTLY